jgi:polyisoprenoid-binding protein YceI
MTSGLTARIHTSEGWPVPDAVLTVTDLSGRQLARATADATGVATTESLPPGVCTAIITAPGFAPVAQVARVGADGSGRVGQITMAPEAGAMRTPPPGPWTIDPVHSTVIVTARHLGIASIKARFAEVSGRLNIAESLDKSTGFAEIKAANIDTGNRMRDDNLRSAEFLDVEKYPVISFSGSGFRRSGGDKLVMPGELTLHGQVRPLELDVTYGGYGPDPWGGVRAAFHAEVQLHRNDFAINYNAMVRAGIAAIGTAVNIDLDIELVQGEQLPQM